MRIISAAAILVFATGCICDGPVSTQFVSGINQVYFADSVANLVEPIIQFTYEVETGNESKPGKKTGCIGYRKELGISYRSFVLSDSVKVTCNKDLPGTPAGVSLEGNPYIEIVKITNDPIDKQQLRTYSFQSNWTVPSWKSMPDTAALTFRFKLSTGEVVVRKNTIVFAK
jgi:hypothetical protein